jgi:penicillin amidase
MKILKRVLIGLVILILLAAGGGYIYLRHLSTRAIPDYDQNVSLKGIKQNVIVYRDAFAVPHIYAENETDLYRATGYVMAQDRLWQMDLMRRLTTGRTAEIFGKDMVKTDLLMRALRMTEKSKLMISKTDPDIVAALEAFADGVNQFIENNKGNLPPEFTILGYEPEKWEGVYSVNLASYMAWDLAFAWNSEIILHKISQKVPTDKFKAMLPNPSNHNFMVHPDFSKPLAAVPELLSGLEDSLLQGSDRLTELAPGVFHGSNNWAVSGKKSTTGKPILANDMHLGLFAPGIWYQVHQVINGKLNVTGLAIPGEPFVVAGHNDHIAWGMTNVMVDDLDFYRETINPDNPDQYKFNGAWKDLEIRQETIKIKGGDSAVETLKFTHRGPVISRFKRIKDRSISMRWTGNMYSNEMRTIYLLNRARNWQEFRDAVKTFNSVSQNIVYADVDGNIGLQTAAGIPVRKGGGQLIVPGDTDEYDWTGIVPFEELPYSFNPESGFVSSANNKTVNDDYPYYISNWFILPHRIDRIREMLKEKEKLSVEDFKQIQADFKSKHVEFYLGGMLTTLEQAGNLLTVEQQALDLLSQWDGAVTPDSAAAALFEKLYLVMVENLIKDELGDDLYDEYVGFKILVQNLMANIWQDRNSAWYDNVDTNTVESFEDWLTASFKETVRTLQEQLDENPAQWQWGKLHRLVLQHPIGRVKILDTLFDFNRGPYEVGGSFHTVCPYNYSFRRPFDSNYGPSHRHIYSTSDWNQSMTIIPTGTSGIPASPFYCDQTRLYLENKYHGDFVDEQRVKENARFRMVISPQ